MYQLKTFGINSFFFIWCLRKRQVARMLTASWSEQWVCVCGVSRINCYCGEAHRARYFHIHCVYVIISICGRLRNEFVGREKKRMWLVKIIILRLVEQILLLRRTTPTSSVLVHTTTTFIVDRYSCVQPFDMSLMSHRLWLCFIYLCVSVWIDILIRLQRNKTIENVSNWKGREWKRRER